MQKPSREIYRQGDLATVRMARSTVRMERAPAGDIATNREPSECPGGPSERPGDRQNAPGARQNAPGARQNDSGLWITAPLEVHGRFSGRRNACSGAGARGAARAKPQIPLSSSMPPPRTSVLLPHSSASARRPSCLLPHPPSLPPSSLVVVVHPPLSSPPWPSLALPCFSRAGRGEGNYPRSFTRVP